MAQRKAAHADGDGGYLHYHTKVTILAVGADAYLCSQGAAGPSSGIQAEETEGDALPRNFERFRSRKLNTLPSLDGLTLVLHDPKPCLRVPSLRYPVLDRGPPRTKSLCSHLCVPCFLMSPVPNDAAERVIAKYIGGGYRTLR